MIAWGDALVRELAARRCIVFMGAGASAGSISTVSNTSPPNWAKLLSSLRDQIPNTNPVYNLADSLISERRFLDAAEVLMSAVHRADFGHFLKRTLEAPRFKPSRVHECVLKIDPKIVITTNYDTIYEKYCREGNAADGYQPITYTDQHLVSRLRTPTRCIIKAHGCVLTPEDVVFSRSSYFNARHIHRSFYSVLDSLFLTNTILFLGYSLSDPDIQLSLENTNISAPSANSHYFVTESGTQQALKDAARRAYNLDFIEFPAGDFGALERSLVDLAERVVQHRIENPDT
jgi:hypothetical protein